MVTPISSKRFTLVSSKDISSHESTFSISVSITGDHWVSLMYFCLDGCAYTTIYIPFYAFFFFFFAKKYIY